MRATSLSLLVVTALGACSPTPCECTPCEPSSAVLLSVIDGRTTAPVSTFLVDATVNGVPLGEPAACSLERRENNTCLFGEVSGLYHLVVTAPGYETRELVVRQAGQGGSDRCCLECLRPSEVTLSLDPLEAP